MAKNKVKTNSTFLRQKKLKLITLLNFCHVVQTNMNSRYKLNKILHVLWKQQGFLKLRCYLQGNLKLCMHQSQYSNHKLIVCFISNNYVQIIRKKSSFRYKTNRKDNNRKQFWKLSLKVKLEHSKQSPDVLYTGNYLCRIVLKFNF